MKELDSRLPILKVFAKLITNEGKESQYEVFVTDKDLDTYKTLWKTPKDKDPSDEKILKDINKQDKKISQLLKKITKK